MARPSSKPRKKLGKQARKAKQREAESQKASEVVLKAKDALAEAQRNHAAHVVREHLVVGEPCPVCEQQVDAVPVSDQQVDLGALQQAQADADAYRETAQRLHMDAEKSQSSADALLRAKREERDQLEASLRDQPPLVEVERQIAGIEAADVTVGAAERSLAKAKEVARGAAKALKEAQANEEHEWRGYHRARDSLAALSPPAPGAALFGAWADLEAWALGQLPKVQENGKALAEHVRDLEHRSEQINQRLAKAFAQHDLPYDDDAKTSVAIAVDQAQSQLDLIRDQLDEKHRCEKQAKEARTEAAVASDLEAHLTARGFPRWMVMAAFDRLVAGASDTLRDLSNGQYMFQRNDNLEFDVIDHGNAGETRSAKTLSGGETFLASLALALTLSEQVADLATAGTARLESIFLDEGFGTLDGETLDTVATAIEELATQGRTVGIVTHVSDLAERIPVRFNVSKTASGATVERIMP